MDDRDRRASPGRPRATAAAKLGKVEEVEVEVEQLVAGGQGLARWEGIPLFIPRSAPGDRLRVRLTDRRADYGRAEIVEVLRPGAGRREAPCPYFEQCGGCDLQHLEDDLQPRLKAEAVVESLRRLGGIELEHPPKLVTGDPWGYRLRAQLHTELPPSREDEEEEDLDGGGQPTPAPLFADRVRVGYHKRGSRELVAVDRCPILVPELEGLLPELPGLLTDEAERVPRRLDLTVGADGSLSTAPVVQGLPHGEVGRKVAGDELRYDARVFFQAHRGLLDRLVGEVVGEWEGKTAYDLFAGVGLFTMALARRYQTVTAVEGDRIAARYCRRNAKRAKLDGVEVIHQVLESWIHHLDKDADRVLLDPPRGGLHRRVRDFLFEFPPKRLTYVSCHAATLARDLRILTRRLDIESVTLLDMFPQTGHMETVVQMTRKA
jgi:23S rRNA (uracil1939-C5)-methyltransferase